MMKYRIITELSYMALCAVRCALWYNTGANGEAREPLRFHREVIHQTASLSGSTLSAPCGGHLKTYIPYGKCTV